MRLREVSNKIGIHYNPEILMLYLCMPAATTPQKYFYRVLQIILESKQTGAFPNLSTSHLQELQQMAADENTCGSTQARALLSKLTEVEFPMNINTENVHLRSLEKKSNQVTTFHVQPNPAKNSAWIDFPFQQDMESVFLTLRDITGKVVFSQNIVSSRGMFEIDSSNLGNGIYLVNLQVDGFDLGNTKLTIQH